MNKKHSVIVENLKTHEKKIHSSYETAQDAWIMKWCLEREYQGNKNIKIKVKEQHE